VSAVVAEVLRDASARDAQQREALEALAAAQRDGETHVWDEALRPIIVFGHAPRRPPPHPPD